MLAQILLIVIINLIKHRNCEQWYCQILKSNINEHNYGDYFYDLQLLNSVHNFDVNA